MTAAEQYARWAVASDNRETGRFIKLAAKRFLDDLNRKDIYFDSNECSVMVDFCEHFLYQWEGDWEGVPLKFELWQKFIFEQVYGWIRLDTKARRFNEVFVEISKKQGKSTMSAGLSCFHVFRDERVNTPKVFTAANNEEQAKICVNMAGRIIEHSPVFSDMIDERLVGLMRYKENITEVINYENNGFIKAFTKESGDKTSKTYGGKHGINASLGIVDEFGMSVDHGASGAIKTSMASRKERLMFYITTAGFNMAGPCYQELRKVGIQVLEGTVIKDNYLPIIYEIDPPVEDGKEKEITLQWLLDNEWAWKQCAPNLDISVSREFLRDALRDAISYGGTVEVETKTLNFNIWVDSPETFISADIWNQNHHGMSADDLEGEQCFAGIEIAPSGAASAVCFLFPGEIVRIKMLFFLAEESLKTNDFYRDNKQYFKIDPGNEVENEVATRWIIEEIQKYNMYSFCFPNTQKNNSIIQELIKEGYEGNPISQGVQGISSVTEEWEKALKAGKVEHFNNPVLAWMNSNCLAVRKENGTRLEKSPRVLGIYACLNAWAQWKTVAAEDTNDAVLTSWK